MACSLAPDPITKILFFMINESRKKDLSIKDVMKEGQEIIVQVSKDERGNKGAALTSYFLDQNQQADNFDSSTDNLIN